MNSTSQPAFTLNFRHSTSGSHRNPSASLRSALHSLATCKELKQYAIDGSKQNCVLKIEVVHADDGHPAVVNIDLVPRLVANAELAR